MEKRERVAISPNLVYYNQHTSPKQALNFNAVSETTEDNPEQQKVRALEERQNELVNKAETTNFTMRK